MTKRKPKVPANDDFRSDRQAPIAATTESTVVFFGGARIVSEGFALALDAMTANVDLFITGFDEHEIPKH